AAGVSTCPALCAHIGPPLMPEAGAMADGEWSLVKRDVGTLQWAYDGKPLFTFINDKLPG
ncbi:hypothetical protein ACMFY5_28035, partial [Pseudomonas sihuiensis]